MKKRDSGNLSLCNEKLTYTFYIERLRGKIVYGPIFKSFAATSFNKKSLEKVLLRFPGCFREEMLIHPHASR